MKGIHYFGPDGWWDRKGKRKTGEDSKIWKIKKENRCITRKRKTQRSRSLMIISKLASAEFGKWIKPVLNVELLPCNILWNNSKTLPVFVDVLSFLNFLSGCGVSLAPWWNPSVNEMYWGCTGCTGQLPGVSLSDWVSFNQVAAGRAYTYSVNLM